MTKRLAGILLAILTAVGLVAVGAAPAGAAPARSTGVPIAVTGADDQGKPVDGTFYAQRAVRHGDGVNLLGTLVLNTRKGTATRTVQMPVDLPASAAGSSAATPAAARAAAAAPAAACQVLNLVLGPLHLNLLGLHIDLNQVNLNLTADPFGGLLGSLLCSLSGGPFGGALSGVLNQIVGVLNQLLGSLGGATA